jgi:hypothetical protein
MSYWHCRNRMVGGASIRLKIIDTRWLNTQSFDKFMFNETALHQI